MVVLLYTRYNTVFENIVLLRICSYHRMAFRKDIISCACFAISDIVDFFLLSELRWSFVPFLLSQLITLLPLHQNTIFVEILLHIFMNRFGELVGFGQRNWDYPCFLIINPIYNVVNIIVLLRHVPIYKLWPKYYCYINA